TVTGGSLCTRPQNLWASSFVSVCLFFFFSSRRRHTRLVSDWSSDDVLFRSRNRRRQDVEAFGCLLRGRLPPKKPRLRPLTMWTETERGFLPGQRCSKQQPRR